MTWPSPERAGFHQPPDNGPPKVLEADRGDGEPPGHEMPLSGPTSRTRSMSKDSAPV
jgi:hypothetical protein